MCTLAQQHKYSSLEYFFRFQVGAADSCLSVLVCIVLLCLLIQFFCCGTLSSSTREELMNIRETTQADLFPTFLLPSVELLDFVIKGVPLLNKNKKKTHSFILSGIKCNACPPTIPDILRHFQTLNIKKLNLSLYKTF